MRNKIVICSLAALMVAGCQRNDPKIVHSAPAVPRDTVRVFLKPDTVFVFRCNANVDSLRAANKELARRLLDREFQLDIARRDVNIVDKDRSQLKFLIGWMKRDLKK